MHIVFWLEKLKGRYKLRRHRRGWRDNTRMVLREIRWEGVEWIHLAQDSDQWWALLSLIMNFWIP
jgi:hypothetical protein